MFFYRELSATEILELLPNNSASTVFEYSDSILFDNTRGYYRSVPNFGSFVGLNVTDTWLITKIEATFTGYYNTPSNCLGQNLFVINYTDGTYDYLGIVDQNSTSPDGQFIYKGDAGVESNAQRNVVGETFTLTVPLNKTVKSIDFYSNYLNGFPEATRGVKDIKIYKKAANPYTSESLPNNSAVSIFADTSNINWDNTRGYYRSNSTWDSNVDMIVSNVSAIKVVEATFTSYYNNPNTCLGNNLIKIKYTDNTEDAIGVIDANADQSLGQTLIKGDLGTEVRVADVISRTFTHSVPVGKTVQKLIFGSNYYPGFPEQLRGVKDIKVYR